LTLLRAVDTDESISLLDLQAIDPAAAARWIAVGLHPPLVNRLRSVELVTANIADLALAASTADSITVDLNAAGHGLIGFRCGKCGSPTGQPLGNNAWCH
jgi:hypothetical protein